MQKQSGMCAFSNACTLPGPRERLSGTNREYCRVHHQAMSLPASAAVAAIDFGSGQWHAPRARARRSGWLDYRGW